jgi:outer membrane receptor protein involved in Fe transport
VHDLVADAMVDVGPFVRARWGLDVIAGMRFDESGTITIPTRAQHSVGLRFAPTKELSWSLDVRNLFDDRTGTYQGFLGTPVNAPIGDAYYYPLPGRTVLLTFRVTASGGP